MSYRLVAPPPQQTPKYRMIAPPREASVGSVAGQTALGLGVDLPVSTVGMLGDLGNAGGEEYANQREQFYQQSPFPNVSRALGAGPDLMKKALSYLPTSEQVMSGVEKITGPIPRPQNTPEKIGRFAGPFISLLKGGKPKMKDAPSVDELRRLKDVAYDAADSGIGKVRMTRTHVEGLQRGVNDAATKGGIGGPLDSTVRGLYSRSVNVIDDLNKLGKEVRGGRVPPPTFGELEKMRQVLRKVANEAVDQKGNITSDGHLATEFIDKIDDLMEKTPFVKARQAHQTLRKAEDIEDALFRAEMGAGANFNQAGLETALRQQFRSMAVQLNKKNWRGWTEAEKDAILKVVQGGPMQNLTRLAGAMSPKGGLSQTLFTLMGIANPAVAAPLAIGTTLARKSAQKQTIKNARLADALVRSGGGAQQASQQTRLPSRLARTLLSANAATGALNYQ
jgi:hypothetical protein